MTATGVISAVLLAAGLMVVVGSCVGMAVLDDPLDRLHLTTPAAMLGSTGICAAVVVRVGFSASGLAAICVAAILIVANPLAGHAVGRAITELRNGTLAEGMPAVPDVVPIGVGHSMGGMILGVQQARHRTFDAVVVLGHGGDGMPEALTAEEAAIDVEQPLVAIETDVAACARLRFAPNTTVERRGSRAGSFLLADVPDGLRRAFEAQRVPLLYSSGLVSMNPWGFLEGRRGDGEQMRIRGATPRWSEMRHSLETRAWMGDATRTAALEKLASLQVKIGYPDEWRDWSTLRVDRTSHSGHRAVPNPPAETAQRPSWHSASKTRTPDSGAHFTFVFIAHRHSAHAGRQSTQQDHTD